MLNVDLTRCRGGDTTGSDVVAPGLIEGTGGLGDLNFEIGVSATVCAVLDGNGVGRSAAEVDVRSVVGASGIPVEGGRIGSAGVPPHTFAPMGKWLGPEPGELL